MIAHLVLFKLKPGFSADDAKVREAFALFAGLRAQCPTIVDWKHGWNVTDRPIAYDYGLYATFATIDDLNGCVPHPAHQAIVSRLKGIADWYLCDYEA